MKILVTGASGLLGLNLSLQMHTQHQIIGVDRSKLAHTPFDLIKLDLLDLDALPKLLSESKPDAVIHCAANALVDACELHPDSASTLNAVLPGRLAKLCAEREIQFLHISTDAVFDGTKEGIYNEKDEPNPLGVYAQTKLDGEIAVLEANPNAAIARVNFFGWSLSGTRSLAEFFVNNLGAAQHVNGFDDVYFCPMFVGDLADTLVGMLSKSLSGMYHVVGSRAITKYEFGQSIARQFGFDASLINPISVSDAGLKAKRSTNLRLSVNKLSTALGREIPNFSTGLAKFYTQYQQRYPQKMRGYQQVREQ
ncbi:MAG: SDR family oxidoreductase [Anaerolineae bacterium]|jgi:dTDP-4-dehydrorhamnose reductase|nr:SDR family oxidoreductase [Anaerolineae bacterium]MBT3712613.1 SDR family oxidoreductase [Anaerolineae bacterium]MBT4311548.1 SDR family oxidoreductase [Anaerolineae bacterium]MBT4457249.1 SDR family oxidoreductase [Anaerolineae bacterium]MBT4842455.1 SDR family oxidoreductase [Anaerolineae bacterium]